MSDTPRTDKAIWKGFFTPQEQDGKHRTSQVVSADVARQLERELNRLRVDATRWDIAVEYMTDANRSTVERMVPRLVPELPEDEFEATKPHLPFGKNIGNPGTLPRDSYAAPQAPGVPGLGRAHALSAESAVAAPSQQLPPDTAAKEPQGPAAADGFIDECLNTLAARKIQNAERYEALKRQALSGQDSADDYGYDAEKFDKDCDELIEWFRKFDVGTLEICPNCDTALPQGCGGQFKQDGEACWWNRGK